VLIAVPEMKGLCMAICSGMSTYVLYAGLFKIAEENHGISRNPVLHK
jgi:hypothetical protein